MLLKSTKWFWSGISFVAVVLALLSPWTAASPFSAPLSLWVAKFLALLIGGGTSVISTKFSPLVIILPLVGAVIFSLPFLGLRGLLSNQRCKRYLTGTTIGVIFVGIGGALELALTRSAAWDPWQVIELAFVVMFGFLLTRSGRAIMRVPRDQSALIKPLGWLMLVIGVCFFSFVLLPVGVIGLAILYFMFGTVFLRSPGLSR